MARRRALLRCCSGSSGGVAGCVWAGACPRRWWLQIEVRLDLVTSGYGAVALAGGGAAVRGADPGGAPADLVCGGRRGSGSWCSQLLLRRVPAASWAQILARLPRIWCVVVSLEFGGLRVALWRFGCGSEKGGWRRGGASLGGGCGAAMMARGAVVVLLAV